MNPYTIVLDNPCEQNYVLKTCTLYRIRSKTQIYSSNELILLFFLDEIKCLTKKSDYESCKEIGDPPWQDWLQFSDRQALVLVCVTALVQSILTKWSPTEICALNSTTSPKISYTPALLIFYSFLTTKKACLILLEKTEAHRNVK